MMSTPCDNVELFADEEMDDAEADSFRMHLADCRRCQVELTSLMQLKALGTIYAERHLAGQPLPPPVVRRAWIWPAAGAGGALLLAASVVAVVALRTPRPGDLWLEGQPNRLIAARTTWAPADRHLPPPLTQMSAERAPLVPLPHNALGELEEKGQLHALAAAHLIRARPQDALYYLDRLERSADVDSDRAAALLALDRDTEALRLLDHVLEQRPSHPQALWNRGLALEKLHLPLLAAKSFAAVAGLDEPGWSTEAAEKAEALRGGVARERRQWSASAQAGKALVTHGMLPLAPLAPELRAAFYDAVRAATTPERVKSLLPLAMELDRRSGGTTLVSYVSRVASSRSFPRRRALAATYLKLFEGHLGQPELLGFIGELRRSEERDLLLGALLRAGMADSLPELERLAGESGDPWLQVAMLQVQADASRAHGDKGAALSTLERALRLGKESHLDDQVMALELELVELLAELDRSEVAWGHAQDGFELALRTGSWGLANASLEQLGRLAKLRNDAPLALAYQGEAIERAKAAEPEVAPPGSQ